MERALPDRRGREQLFPLLALAVVSCGADILTPVDCGPDACPVRQEADPCDAGAACACGEDAPCPAGELCSDGQCVAWAAHCIPSCAGACAGADDGCGGACASSDCDGCCTADALCVPSSEQDEAQCGLPGSSCAPCAPWESCGNGFVASVCLCAPDCAGKCGGASNGCNGTCNQPCASYAWRTGDWGLCSASCGGGTTARPVECRRDDGAIVADSLCSGPRPPAVASCNTAACCVPSCTGRCGGTSDGCGGTCDTPCATYAWIEGSWGACSASCGGGTMMRSVQCRRNDGAIVPDSFCSAPRPAVAQSCNTQPCCAPSCSGKCGGASDGCGGTCDTPCATYAWLLGDWGTCSASCGGGTMTRSVRCQRNDGAIVHPSFCPAPEPVSSASCNTQACCVPSCTGKCGGASDGCGGTCNAICYSYAWSTGDWGECSSACDGGSMFRSVVCRRSDGAVVSDAYCGGAKPAGSLSCNTHACFTVHIAGHEVVECSTANWVGPYYGCDCNTLGTMQQAHWSSAPNGTYCPGDLWPHWVTTYWCSAADGVCP